MRLMILLLLLLPLAGGAQTIVDPDDLRLSISLEEAVDAPYEQEMVLLTIHGVYRRHITRENLSHPALPGLNWMQLGSDHWYDSRVNGVLVKNMVRRMALFPEQAGEITIPPFTHRLTLLDDDNKWFEHDIQSNSLRLTVRPAPAVDGWWFPVRNLQVSDQWSNAPDQLGAGDGVLRVVRLTAVGAAPDLLPPMPDLQSPSAHIFAHPEKRLVELSPQGPVSIAFWRWTIKPKSPPSSILEPITFPYFDTTERVSKIVKIAAQRVAFEDTETRAATPPIPPRAGGFAPLRLWIVLILACGIGLAMGLAGRRMIGSAAFWARLLRIRDRMALRFFAIRGDVRGLRRVARRSVGAGPALTALDDRIFARDAPPLSGRALRGFAHRFLRIGD